MTDFGSWASMLPFPAGVLVLMLVLLWVHRRDAARWARERKSSGTPAE